MKNLLVLFFALLFLLISSTHHYSEVEPPAGIDIADCDFGNAD
jgi:hypothetical protein